MRMMALGAGLSAAARNGWNPGSTGWHCLATLTRIRLRFSGCQTIGTGYSCPRNGRDDVASFAETRRVA